MASIDKRPNGTYRIRVSSGTDANGKRLVETLNYTPTETSPTKIEKEVQRVALEFEERVKNGLYVSGDKISFADYVQIWREQWAVDNLTQNGLESYVGMLDRKIIPAIGNIPIGQIRPTHIQSIVTDMKNKGREITTIRKYLVAVNSVFKYAFDMEVIESNPCDRVRAPKRPSKDELHYFTVEQVNMFFEALKGTYACVVPGHKSRHPKSGKVFEVKAYNQYTTIPFQWRVYFDLCVFGSFRRGELIGLKWIDIDWENKTVSIRRATSMIKGGQIDKTPKTKSGIRTVSLPETSINLLHDWYVMQKELSFTLGTLWEGERGRSFDNNYIFINLENGKQMHIQTPTHKFPEIIKMYNDTCENEEDKLPLIHLHDLRHTSATIMISNGVDISTVSHRLGHAHTSVTLDVYSHWMQNKDVEASDMLENLIRRKA